MTARKLAVVLKPYEQVDAELRQSAAKIAGSFFDFVDLAARAIDEQVYVHFGFTDPLPYFQQRVGIKYRTVKRWLSIRVAVLRLPEDEQVDARKALAGIGAHKASVLAPLIGQPPKAGEPVRDWRETVRIAETSTEEGLQEYVTGLTGASRKTSDGSAGARFLGGILLHMHPDVQPYVQAVFDALAKEYELTDPRAAFLIMIDMANRDLGDSGVEVRTVGG